MHLAIVGSRGIPARYGGFETLAEQLGRRLVRRGNEVTVVCEPNSLGQRERLDGVRLQYFPLEPFWRPAYEFLLDTTSLARLSRQADCILVLGYIGAPAFQFVKIRATPLVVNINGFEWKRPKLRRPLGDLLRIFESISIRTASIVIADSREMERYVETTYGVGARFIPYGADHCQTGLPFEADRLEKILREPATRGTLEPGGYYLVVARLEPENMIHTIVSAFRRLQSNRQLLIVGGFSNTKYSKRVKQIANGDPRIAFLGPLYDRDAVDMLRTHCFAYLHGHTVGGTNPALLEAMFLGAPTIAFNNVFNAEVGAGTISYFQSEDDLLKVLQEYESDIVNVRHMAAGAKERIASQYTWAKVTDAYQKAFEEALG